LIAHLLVTLAKLARPGGLGAVAAESLTVKHQLLIIKRVQRRAPKLTLACLFAAAALSGALIESVAAGNIHSADSENYYLGRRAIDALLNLFAMKMAAAFMISTCTIGLRSAILPRWVVFVGYACALVLLVVIASWKWIALIFPLWMLAVSIQMLMAEFRSRHAWTASA
jgi:hypothetical protein